LVSKPHSSVRQQHQQVICCNSQSGLAYYIVGSTLNLFFEDELSGLNQINKNMLCGAITGGIYKSTLGKDIAPL
jgi:hypothetical protein